MTDIFAAYRRCHNRNAGKSVRTKSVMRIYSWAMTETVSKFLAELFGINIPSLLCARLFFVPLHGENSLPYISLLFSARMRSAAGGGKKSFECLNGGASCGTFFLRLSVFRRLRGGGGVRRIPLWSGMAAADGNDACARLKRRGLEAVGAESGFRAPVAP